MSTPQESQEKRPQVGQLGPKFELDRLLDKIAALGGALGNQDHDTPLEGEYLEEIGYMIQDLATEAKTILSEMLTPAKPEGGA
jgi:hypothetical protein